MTMTTRGFAAHSAKDALPPHQFARRDPRPDDVVIEILYCGVCHSDLHIARNDWGFSTYPVVPGHEIGRPGVKRRAGCLPAGPVAVGPVRPLSPATHPQSTGSSTVNVEP